MSLLTFWTIVELLRFLNPKCYRNHHAKFEVYRTIISNRKKLIVKEGRTYGLTKLNFRLASLLKKLFYMNKPNNDNNFQTVKIKKSDNETIEH